MLPRVQRVADPARTATYGRGGKMQLIAFRICAGCPLFDPVQLNGSFKNFASRP